MVINKNKFFYLVIFCLLFVEKTEAIFAINVFNPWDINLRPPIWCDTSFQITGYDEFGLKARGYNPDNDKVNVMQLWQPTQDALAMIQSLPATNPLRNILQNIQDDGVRGHFTVTGKFDLNASAGISARYHLPYNITISAHLPFYAMKLKNVLFQDLTLDDDSTENLLVRENLTDNFLQVMEELDPSLDLTGWKRTGVGDFAVFAAWQGSYCQAKPILKNVDLTTRLGVTLPSGLRTNEDQILSIPFGYNGSAGLWFGAGITLNWFDYIRGGLDFEFLHLFGNSRFQRIKIQRDQTDLLFLTKVYAHTDYGFTQQYNLYFEGYRFFHGLSAGMIYQFWRHGEDKLALFTNLYSDDIANTAEKLQEWTMHQVIFKLNYDFECDLDACSKLKPNIFVFYKLPFNGTRAILVNTVGVAITLNF